MRMAYQAGNDFQSGRCAVSLAFHKASSVMPSASVMLNTALHPATSPGWSVTHIDEVIAEHNEIIATLASGDMRRAAEAARAHILSFKRALLSA